MHSENNTAVLDHEEVEAADLADRTDSEIEPSNLWNLPNLWFNSFASWRQALSKLGEDRR